MKKVAYAPFQVSLRSRKSNMNNQARPGDERNNFLNRLDQVGIIISKIKILQRGFVANLSNGVLPRRLNKSSVV